MANWSEVEAAAPELAARVKAYLDVMVHKTLATLRRDGSPRISGSECIFSEGELWFGSMWMAVKALDLRRDPRFALHSGSPDPDAGWEGDGKVAGRAVEITDPETVARINGGSPGGRSHLFRADLDEVVAIYLTEDREALVIESWHAGRGVTLRRR